MAPETSPPNGARHTFGAAHWLLVLATAASFLLVFHNFGLDILPHRVVRIPAAQIRPYSKDKTFAYVFDYDGSEGDRWPSTRSRLSFFENGTPYRLRERQPDEVALVGGDRFTHEAGRVVFSTIQNDDPRTNGRTYTLLAPVLYSVAIGDTALLVFLCCVGAWTFAYRVQPRRRGSLRSSVPWKGHILAATLLFLLGLYCNTGTLAPYANTNVPIVVPETGYAYNGDHGQFRALFDFVDGSPRATWDHAVLLRRILFPFLGWPLMKLLGFEIGGAITSLVLSTAAFVAFLFGLRRFLGERGSIFAGWILALYPGAAYWAGLPYTYALIFPLCLLLMLALMRLSEPSDIKMVAAISLGMGLAYLGYDLAINFIPASVLVLCWRRRFAAAALAGIVQVIPLGVWLWTLGHVFHQPLLNGNSGIYTGVLNEFMHPAGGAWWWQQATQAPGYGSDIFFASNFIFIPALFLLVLCLNAATSRISFKVAEVGLLLSGLAVFLVLNLAPSDQGGWQMRGTWIARLYQPVFPAFVVFMARWWQDLPLPSRWSSPLGVLCVTAASVGNALIVFGPILNDPWRISGNAFYQFYDHTPAHFVYRQNLRELGRRPLGFPRVMKELTPEGILARERSERDAAQKSLLDLRNAATQAGIALSQVRTTLRDVGGSIAEARRTLFEKRQAARLAKGEITAEQARTLAQPPEAFIPPELKALLSEPSLGATPPRTPTDPTPTTMATITGEIDRDSLELARNQHALVEAESALKAALKEQGRALDELNRFDNAASSARRP